MGRICIRQRSIQSAVVLFVAGIASTAFSFRDGAEGYTDMAGMYWLIVISGMVLIQTHDIKASKNIKYTIASGYALRVMFAWLQTYMPSRLPYFMVEGSDQSTFMHVALRYFDNDMYRFYTYFPYVLEKMFHIFGKDEFAIRLLFVYMWFLGCILLERVAGKLEGRRHQLIMAFYTLLPWWVYISTAILRDEIKAFFLMLSLYQLVMWMKGGKPAWIIMSVASVLPAALMHGADTVMAVVILLAFCFWDPFSQRWNTERCKKKYWLIVIAVSTFPMFYGVLKIISPDFLPASFSFKAVFERIVPYDNARTNYVPKAEIHNMWQFAYWSLYRMFYFWMSPTFKFWSSAGDMLMFAVDTLPWVCMFVYLATGLASGKLDNAAKALVIIFMLFTFVYAWGTRNAGTAMRHRDHLLGLFAMLGLMRKERGGICAG